MGNPSGKPFALYHSFQATLCGETTAPGAGSVLDETKALWLALLARFQAVLVSELVGFDCRQAGEVMIAQPERCYLAFSC